jgi:hypothetical protein
MGRLLDVLVNVYALLGTVPFLLFPLAGLSAYLVVRDKKKAVRFAADFTMFFLIGSVSVIYDELFHTAVKGFWIVLLILLLLTGFLGNLQNRVRGRLDPDKLVRAVWRIGFLILAAAYLLLLIIGIIKQMIVAT